MHLSELIFNIIIEPIKETQVLEDELYEIIWIICPFGDTPKLYEGCCNLLAFCGGILHRGQASTGSHVFLKPACPRLFL